MRAVNRASRLSGRGQGTVAGGRVALRLSPRLLERLAATSDVALVSGTNGKTTTTACLAAALATRGQVATNETGSNMLPGHVAALAAARRAASAVLECDEVWLARALVVSAPAAVVLLNLSRDQLDRTAEVRHVADAWRSSLVGFGGWCVANTDDPLVVHAATACAQIAWFAGGIAFAGDAVACPRCARGLERDGEHWSCACGLARPTPDATPTATGALVDGAEVGFTMQLPGWFNHANGVAALLCAARLGVPVGAAADAIGAVSAVAGRFSSIVVDDVSARLLLAKNPAGWSALLDLLLEGDAPLVLAVNARTADGLDPSWLYDVEFERLRGRRIVVSGERWRDLSARLFYAGVDHDCEQHLRLAIMAAGRERLRVDVVANYTAFADLHRGR